MSIDKRTRERMRDLCGEIHEDDGVDPREFFKSNQHRRKGNYKTKQLCQQVAVTLEQVLSGEISDPALNCLRVLSAEPAPDASRLLVTLQADCLPQEFQPLKTQERLNQRLGQLRAAVSATITRRKTPGLSFVVLAPPINTPSERKEVGE